jgi:hypothetical protein
MKALYKEKQKFRQWWLWMVLIIIPMLSVNNLHKEEIKSYYSIITLIIPIFFYFLELRTYVTQDGVYYQFFPLHLKLHLIKKDNIKKIEAIKYNPIGDYGGWGIRRGFKGKAYNVYGNKGVKIYLKDGKNILFGSQDYRELERITKKITEL